MNSKNLKIVKALIKLNGKEASIDKIAEECIELGLAILQLKCPTKTDKKRRLEDVYKELADVKIVLKKADYLFNRRKINRLVNKKLQRKQLKYLTNEKNKSGV